MSRRSLSQLENSSVLLISGICSAYATDAILSTRGLYDPTNPGRRWREHYYRLRCLPGKSRMAWSSAPDKNITLRRYPKSPLQLPPSRTHERGVSRSSRTLGAGCDGRGSVGRAKGSQGELRLVSDQPARRRPALKRLRQDFGRQHMSRSKRFGGGSCGRQKRVVLAPVAGFKLMEICRAQPGFGWSPIRQRRWQEEFVAGESAL
ncbi:hypothetical protein V1279_000730 [Bradyrhizobium sp. AZCC 1610]